MPARRVPPSSASSAAAWSDPRLNRDRSLHPSDGGVQVRAHVIDHDIHPSLWGSSSRPERVTWAIDVQRCRHDPRRDATPAQYGLQSAQLLMQLARASVVPRTSSHTPCATRSRSCAEPTQASPGSGTQRASPGRGGAASRGGTAGATRSPCRCSVTTTRDALLVLPMVAAAEGRPAADRRAGS
jgi:hypothetical protein